MKINRTYAILTLLVLSAALCIGCDLKVPVREMTDAKKGITAALHAVQYGTDMFDSVMPTRIARNGTLFTSEGRINIKSSIYESDFSPLDGRCGCYVCKKFTRSYLRHLFRAGEISALIYNTYHNLFFMKSFMEEVRQSILRGSFMELSRKWTGIYRNECAPEANDAHNNTTGNEES